VLDFECGAVATLVTSFDVWAHSLPFFEVYGSLGSLSVPDPNNFGGPVRLACAGNREWTDVPLTHGYTSNSRSLGLADMAYALRTGRPARAGGDLCYHVLDVMCAIEEASVGGCHVELTSACVQPAALPRGLTAGRLDA
jgi:predicted dehydrogenase